MLLISALTTFRLKTHYPHPSPWNDVTSRSPCHASDGTPLWLIMASSWQKKPVVKEEVVKEVKEVVKEEVKKEEEEEAAPATDENAKEEIHAKHPTRYQYSGLHKREKLIQVMLRAHLRSEHHTVCPTVIQIVRH